MGISAQSGGRSGRRRRAAARPMSEINVTPFVDVMLVLLIIFMVAAPLLTTGVEVNLPQTEAAALPSEKQEPLVLTVDADGAIWLQENQQDLGTLTETLSAVRTARGEDGGRIYFRADGSLSYGYVEQVLAMVRNADFDSIAMVHVQSEPAE